MATPFTDQDDYYKMDASPKGICLIINNFEFERSRRLDTGPADKENLIRTFKKMDFDVRYFENQTRPQIKTEMKNIQKEDHSNYDCFVCCISSHGDTTGVCGADDQTVNISKLQKYVYSTQCRSLAGKPKVFFVDACRGGEDQKGHYQARSGAPVGGVVITDKRDFLVSFATTPDNKSYCNPDSTKGAVYFYHLTRLLEHYANSKTITQILYKLNGILTAACPERALQTAECFSTLAKELCFYRPVQAMVSATLPNNPLEQKVRQLQLNLSSADQRHQSECARYAKQLSALQQKFADTRKRVQVLEQEVNRKDDQFKRKEAEIASCRYDIHCKVEEVEELQTELQGEKARHQKTTKQLKDSNKTCSSLESDVASYQLMLREFSDKAPLRETFVTLPYRPTHPQTKVHITKRDGGVWALNVGVVTSSPDSLTLPDGALGWESAVAVYCNGFNDHGDERVSDIGKALSDLPVGSSVGLRLDSSRSLHLHVNGADQGVVPCRPLPGPCWAWWELNRSYTEITSLPVRYVS